MDLFDRILEWINSNLGVIFMGVAGATVTALTSTNKHVLERVIGWIVGVILCAALSSPTANFLTSGDYVEVFGFIYGMGGITLAKMLIKAIEKKGKEKLGVGSNDDNS